MRFRLLSLLPLWAILTVPAFASPVSVTAFGRNCGNHFRL